MSEPKVSCHFITWGNDFQTALKEAAELGYRACETFTHIAMAYENRIGDFTDLLDSHGFTLSALYGGGRFSDPAKRQETVDYNERVAKFLSTVGCDRIVFGPGGPRTPGGTTPGELAEAVKTIDEAAKRCAEMGVKACLHPHLFTELQDQKEIEFVMDNTDPEAVFFCPDTAHLSKAGIDVAGIIRDYADRVAYMHIKDVTPDDVDPSAFPDFKGTESLPIFCELGLGTVDLQGIMKVVREIGYDGWITMEIDASTSTPSNSLRICRDYAQHTLGLDIGATS